MTISITLVLISMILIGIYICACALMKSPIKPKRQKRKESSLDIFLRTASNKLAPFIKLSKQKEQRLSRALEITESKDTAKSFAAKVLLKAGLVFILSCVLYIMSSFLGICGCILTALVYWDEYKRLYKKGAQIKEQLENEAAPFAAYIKEKLTGGERNVIKLLEEYTLSENPLFAHELLVTVASMRTSSPENGLMQLSKRLSSEKINMIIMGLLGVARGDNQQFYFQMISYDFDVLDKNSLRKKADAIPKKLTLYMFLLAGVAFLELLMPLIIVIIENFNKFFK